MAENQHDARSKKSLSLGQVSVLYRIFKSFPIRLDTNCYIMNNPGPIEAALSSDLRSSPYNFSLWDIHTGTQLINFKNSESNIIPKCLQLIDKNHFITAQGSVLNVWSIFDRKCLPQKLFLPARPSILCISPCSNYLIAGIAEMIYIWQLYSGNLLANVQRHYQTISVLKLNQDGTVLISAGEDGLVLVWPFADLISGTHYTGSLNLDKSRKDVGVNEPRFTWQHHSAQVTDLHVSNGDLCVSCSTDKTINIYDYQTGARLFEVALPEPLWSVVINRNETKMFLGGQEGNIYEVALSSISLSTTNPSGRDGEASKPIFAGHKGKVTNLLVSIDGTRLVSASNDSTCKIWDVCQRKMLQDIKHQAPLANLTSLLIPNALALKSMNQSKSPSPLTFRPLKRNLYKQPRDTTVVIDELFEEGSTLTIRIKNEIDHWHYSIDKQNSELSGITNIRKQQIPKRAEPAGHNRQVNTESVAELKGKLKNLYLLSVEKLFSDTAGEALKNFKPIIEEIDKSEQDGNLMVARVKKVSKKRKSSTNDTAANGHDETRPQAESEIIEKKKKKKKLTAKEQDYDIFVD